MQSERLEADGFRPIPQPEPGLTPAELVARATALRPLLRGQQEEADARGHYGEEVHRAFLRAGFYRTLQPVLFGGYAFDLPTFARVIIEIGRGHPATGWCFTLAASHCLLFGSHWPAETQRELFGPTGDFRAPHRAPPAGTWVREAGGYRVTGTWSYSSGVPVSTHFIGGGLLPAEEGPPRQINFIVPIDRVTILPDWGGEASLGMQGSGSNSVRLEDVFVPDRYIARGDKLFVQPENCEGTPGTALHGNPMYLGQLGGAYHATLGAITTGTARAAIDEYEHLMRTRPTTMNKQLSRMDDPESQRAIGKALTLTDSAEALTLAAAQLYMDYCRRWAEHGTRFTGEDTLRIWGMAQEACFMACEAVELLFHTAGSTAANQGQRLQRYFRDVQMYRIHPAAQPTIVVARGQSYLGLPAGPFGSPRG